MIMIKSTWNQIQTSKTVIKCESLVNIFHLYLAAVYNDQRNVCDPASLYSFYFIFSHSTLFNLLWHNLSWHKLKLHWNMLLVASPPYHIYDDLASNALLLERLGFRKTSLFQQGDVNFGSALFYCYTVSSH